MKWTENINKLLEITQKAGEAILNIYNSDDFNIEQKKDNSPLTRADKAANAVICDALLHYFPEIPIISEENKEVEYAIRKTYEYYWLIDPLDGTKEFIKRNGEFTVNIALIHQHEVVGGIVYAPVISWLGHAFKGSGAYRIIKGVPKKLTAGSFSMTDTQLRVVCSRSHLNADTQRYLDQLLNPEIVSKGSSLKFLMLAEGEAEIYPRLAPTMEWDTAAAQIILEEAGGQVINHETGEKLKYNKPSLTNPHFIAYADIR